ncbi:MAG TPA: 2-oxoglutarate dehydrogenase E1 component [Oscillatoriaceae cyanobacterium]
MSVSEPTFLSGANAAFVEGMYEAYLHDPFSVDPEWRHYFEQVRPDGAERAHFPVQQAFLRLAEQRRTIAAAAPSEAPSSVIGAMALINAYRTLGHLAARINPLGSKAEIPVPELDPAYYGLTDADMNVPITEAPLTGTLREVVAQLKKIYCGPIGFEYGELPRLEREWLHTRIESDGGRGRFDAETRKRILEKLNAAEGLEKYLHARYVGQKRFSLEGGETLIPMLDQTIQRAGAAGTHEIVVGMAHRGRLNVLINLFGKPTSELFAEFEGTKDLPEGLSGDVKYHMGYSADVATPGGAVHMALAFNPSHLELVDPVVEGSVRARQDYRGDTQRKQVLPILIHGDAALPGQGIVSETLNMSRLRGYTTGGTLHVVVNNQVGFTTSNPQDVRSGYYATDIAKFIQAPVFHVNGDDPDAAVYACQLAMDFLRAFRKDVFVDLVCFRRHGHNEADEPRVTQPGMYKLVDQHPGTRALYAQALEKDGLLGADEAKQLQNRYRDALDAAQSVAEHAEPGVDKAYLKRWEPYYGKRWTAPGETRVPLAELKKLGAKLTAIPEGFKLHPRVEAIIKARRAMTEGTQPLDWGMAENLAYASLLEQGYRVRITGQDVGRGTFFHRHAVLHNQADGGGAEGELLIPLRHVESGARFELYDSPLSEESVLGFEFGYSSTLPDALVIWEAQFGDFANGAQAVIDQYISASETKWSRYAGLVMLLPHGYEGQGPEHSSARLERFLQLGGEENIQVCVPSTPAQMFHLLRRQMVRPYRKPLVVMTPKSLLRHKLSVSSLEDLADRGYQLVIGDEQVQSGKRVVLCSGKLYFELVEAREKAGARDVAIVRIEQLYPFPATQLREQLLKYPNAQVVWAQEEPQNQGAWLMIRDDLQGCLSEGQTLGYAGRARAASPATGVHHLHAVQQSALIHQALGVAQPALAH